MGRRAIGVALSDENAVALSCGSAEADRQPRQIGVAILDPSDPRAVQLYGLTTC